MKKPIVPAAAKGANRMHHSLPVRVLKVALLSLAASVAMRPALANPPQPDQVVRIAADSIMQELGNHGDEFNRHPEKLYELVDARLAGYFDFDSISESVLGRFKREVTPQQMERFKAAFRQTLLQSYSNAMRGYENNRIEWLPSRFDPERSQATVEFLLVRSNGSSVPVTFYMRHRDNEWRVYDISIDAIGLVTTYRSSFSPELKRNGIDALTARLENKLAH
jgi:phospholipid transport system substrate-binding protein